MSSPAFIMPVLSPADIETMSQLFLVPLMTPTLVATRLPDDTDPTDTEHGFLRVEAGPCTKPNWFQYNITTLLHLYIPFEYETLGMGLAGEATGYMAAAAGLTVMGYYIAHVLHVIGPERKTDPDVNLLRYRSAVTWTVDGTPAAPTWHS